jgi:hypothetical protein
MSVNQDMLGDRELSDEKLIEFVERTGREIADKFGVRPDMIFHDINPRKM